MPELCTLKIKEIFWSFQGEGLRAGTPSIFLRLSGCSYRCPYCDTIDSWDSGAPMALIDILFALRSRKIQYPQSQIVITGGEPMEQDLSQLTQSLKREGFYLAIETNGGSFQDVPIDWWTVSPKDVASYAIHPELIRKINEIKLVVNSNLSIDIVKRIRATVPHAPIFLQPDGSSPDRYNKTFSLFCQCQENAMENIRCGIQLHKVYEVQ